MLCARPPLRPALVAAFFVACGDAEQEPFACNVAAAVDCPDLPVRYQDVAGVFESRCVICHDSDPGDGGPWPLATYEHVTGWWDLVRDEIQSCSMPPRDSFVRLQPDESEAILTWIACGVPR